jgi:alanine racemase
VSLDAVARNFRVLGRRGGGTGRVIAVLKADGYGHGAVPLARRLLAEGADVFAVAIASEAIALRRAGVSGELLLLNFTDPAEAPACRGYGLTPVLHDLAQAAAYAEATRAFSTPLPVHVKVDTGMARLGVRPEQLGELADLLRRAPGLVVRGTLTQFSRGDEEDSGPTRKQVETMRAALDVLRNAGVSPGLVHVANSAGALFHRGCAFDAVRPGIALYGISPSETRMDEELVPAMSLETHVMAVRGVAAGRSAGYGTTFVAARPSTIAVLPIGYDDGLRRSFSGKISVLLPRGRAPIVGAVSMDMTLVDATDCGAAPGEDAILLGVRGNDRVTAWDLARAAGTIPYEIVCGIGRRVPRVYS